MRLLASIGIFVINIALGQSVEIVTTPAPQALLNSCQSYALAFTLASSGAPGFSANSIKSLREEELKVRRVITDYAKILHQPSTSHEVWSAAVKALTAGSYELTSKSFDRIDAFADFVGQMTGVSNAITTGNVISLLTLKTPVMTSFTRIESSRYSGGHIVVVMGVDKRTKVGRPLLVLNSAVKSRGSSHVLCEESQMPGDTLYTATASIVTDYQLNAYGGKYLALWIRKK